jgi:hypothetical protein
LIPAHRVLDPCSLLVRSLARSTHHQHHKIACTPPDLSSAARGSTFYDFAPRYIGGSYQMVRDQRAGSLGRAAARLAQASSLVRGVARSRKHTGWARAAL